MYTVLEEIYEGGSARRVSALILDEDTHKGLFQYTRLPWGISSSPAIWQRFIEQV